MRAHRAAAYLDMGPSTFLRFVEQDRLTQAKKVGGVTFWDRLELDAFVESCADDGDNRLEQLLGGENLFGATGLQFLA